MRWRAVLWVAAVVAVAPSASAQPSGPPATVDYEPRRGVPIGYHLDYQPSPALLAIGWSVLGVTYNGSVWLGTIAELIDSSSESCEISGDCHHDGLPLFVPLVGPFIGVGTLQTDGGVTAGLAALGAFQIAGATTVALAYVLPRRRWIRNDLSSLPPLRLAPARGGLTLTFGGRI